MSLGEVEIIDVSIPLAIAISLSGRFTAWGMSAPDASVRFRGP